MAGTSGSKMLDREKCQAAFHSFQMGSLSLLRYEKEFNNLIEFMKLAEVEPQPTQADLSLKYIMKLGPQYNSLKVFLENELSFGKDSYPKMLADAHRTTR